MRISDRSSNVCSSDLLHGPEPHKDCALACCFATGNVCNRRERSPPPLTRRGKTGDPEVLPEAGVAWPGPGRVTYSAAMTQPHDPPDLARRRSEERRVGKACVGTCSSRWPAVQ